MVLINALVVDDSDIFRYVSVKMMVELEVNTDQAETYRNAVNLIKNNKEKYNLLLCDTSLGDPDGNRFGIDVANYFREHNPNGVIVAMSSSESMKEHWQGKCDYFFGKSDINKQNLQQIIQKHFD